MFLIELIGDAIIDAWFALMQWIIPEKMPGKHTRIILKIIVGLFTGILFLSVVLGVFAIISDDADTKQMGRYMVFIPLAISAVQIVVGIIHYYILLSKIPLQSFI